MFILLVSFTIMADTQSSNNGVMTGSSDSTALSGVAITLVKNNVLQHITQTSEKGHSELNTISNRDYLLVSALIGYQIDTLKLSIHKSNISGLHIKLNEATESFQ